MMVVQHQGAHSPAADQVCGIREASSAAHGDSDDAPVSRRAYGSQNSTSKLAVHIWNSEEEIAPSES